MNLQKYLAIWDPYGLVEPNVNKDEYESEANQIKAVFSASLSDAEVGELVYKTFVDNFEHDFPGLKEECIRRGSAIKNLLI